MRIVHHSVWSLVRKAVRSPGFLPALAKLCHLFAGAAGVGAVALLFPDKGLPDVWAMFKAVALIVVGATMFLASVLFAQGDHNEHCRE